MQLETHFILGDYVTKEDHPTFGVIYEIGEGARAGQVLVVWTKGKILWEPIEKLTRI